MKIFISYCEHNGGKELAKNIASIYEIEKRNKCWYFDRNKTPGLNLTHDIDDVVLEWCNCVVLLCTQGTCGSEGQKHEIELSLENRISLIPIRVDGAKVPDDLPNKMIWLGIKIHTAIQDICEIAYFYNAFFIKFLNSF